MKPRILFVILCIIGVISACVGTNRAYKAAEGPEQNAKVVAEHYYALVREANDLKKSGILAGGNLVKAQQLVRDTRPAIDKLSTAAQAYGAVQTAETEAELEAAISAAVIAISELIDIIKATRDSSRAGSPGSLSYGIYRKPGFRPILVKTASPAAV